jgi:hypothetical protein
VSMGEARRGRTITTEYESGAKMMEAVSGPRGFVGGLIQQPWSAIFSEGLAPWACCAAVG